MISLQQLVNKKDISQPVRVTFHIFLWLAYWAIAYYFNSVSFNLFAKTRLAWLEPLCELLNLIIFYYPFMYFTWPRFLRKKKYLPGLILLCAQIILYTIIYEVQERLLIAHCNACTDILAEVPPRFKQGMNQDLSSGIMSALFSFGIVYILIAKLSPVIAIKTALDFNREKTAAMELEKENLMLEFNFLKSQVNPHFLFNTLNNIHSLVIQEKKTMASNTIAKFSHFLRYSLYNSENENTSLAKEIKLLEDYIELEKLRLNKTTVTLTVANTDDAVYIPPLLFFPLVENAFKFSADNLPGNSFIAITAELRDHRLTFVVKNNYDPAKRNNDGGIGMKNLRKRLNLAYPGNHRVDISDKDYIYEIKIHIQL